VGKQLPLLQSRAVVWVRNWVWVILALHHDIDKVEKPSLHGIHHHDPETSPIIISSVSFFSLLFFMSRQSTISLRLRHPNAPRNTTSIVRSFHSEDAA
jgi:hypothetical protein